MKNLYIVILFLLALISPAVAQTQSGSINGVVRDEQSATVPGADVTLQGSDATYHFTTELDGAFRFLNLEPGSYRLTADLSGFRMAVREVIVAVGKHIDAPIVLHVAAVAESITVTAPAPILDATATAFSKDELAKIPTSRDPFSLLRSVPGVLLDRLNVGGNETGQAPTVV